MATYKNTNGDYIITVADGSGNLAVNADFAVSGNTASFTASSAITLNAPQTTLNGNLNVVGNVTYVSVQDILVDDPFITVAANNNGTVETAVFQSQGLVTQTSASTYAGIRFDNANLTWQISSSVTSSGDAISEYANVAISSGPFLVAALNNTGDISTAQWITQGILAQTSSETYAGLRFNNSTLKWEVSSGVTAGGEPLDPYYEIIAGAAGSSFDIQFNYNGALTGTANLAYDPDLSKLTLSGYQVFGNIGGPPDGVLDSAVVYHNPEGQGGTGLYVKTDSVDEELISKSRAIVFGLIL